MMLVVSVAAALLAAQGDSAKKDDAEKKICKRVEVTGTILPKRECRTKAEWAAIAEANEANTDRYSRARDTTSGRGPRTNGY